jgi:uncharacterized protein (TIGR00369 family)
MRAMIDDGRLAALEQVNRQFVQTVPFNRALGIQAIGLGDGTARFRLPYRQDLVGNPESGVLHGGAITALLDVTCASAVFMKLTRRVSIATLELRIDYLGPATVGRAVLCEATCYRVTRHIAFVRGAASHDDDGAPIATAAGTFMLGTASRRDAP